MSKVALSSELGKTTDPKEFIRFCSQTISDIIAVINGKLDINGNLNVALLTVTFTSANADKTVSHSLGRVPTGYIVYSGSAAGSVYDGTVAWTASAITLKCSQAITVKLILF